MQNASSRRAPKDDRLSAAEPVAGELVTLGMQVRHRLSAMEAEIREWARGGEISPRQFERRVARLEQAHEKLAELERLAGEIAAEPRADADVGLPLSTAWAPVEARISDDYLGAAATVAFQVATEAERVRRWLGDAVSGRADSLRMTLRFSRLKRVVERHEHRVTQLAEAHQLQEGQADALIKEIRGRAATPPEKLTLTTLVGLYQEVDGWVARIATLKSQVNRGQRKTTQLRLALEAERMRQDIDATEGQLPPSPHALVQALRSVQDEFGPSRRWAKARHSLAGKFVDDVMNETTSSEAPPLGIAALTPMAAKMNTLTASTPSTATPPASFRRDTVSRGLPDLPDFRETAEVIGDASFDITRVAVEEGLA